MPSEEKRIYTIDDIESLPEGERAELIDGKIFYMSSPRYIHQKLLMELSTEIHNYIKHTLHELQGMIIYMPTREDRLRKCNNKIKIHMTEK